MKLSELLDLVRIQSGQFEFNLEELSPTKHMHLLTRKVLPLLNRHMPYTQDQAIEITQSPYIYTTEDIPNWISSVVPIGNVTPINILMNSELQNFSFTDINKPTFIWKYINPKLYVEFIGRVLVKECYKAKLVEDSSQDFDISLVNDDAIGHMVDLLTGYVMVAIGRGRRAAKLVDLPIELDSADLVAEGNELILNTIDDLKLNSDFTLSLGD